MANQYTNKVVINGSVKIDLTGDTVTADKLQQGITAHDRSGAPITGTSTKNADTSDSTVSTDEVLAGEVFHVADGSRAVGTMPNRGKYDIAITDKDSPITIPQGYHDGSGKAAIDATEAAKLIPSNIRQGISVLGIQGTMSSSEGVKAQAKTATPTFSQQNILPDSGYTHLSQVTVAAIPVTYADNASGGQTLTVG